MRTCLAFVLILCTCLAQGQAHWQALGNFPGPARDDASGLVCNGYGYMGTGFGTGFVHLNDWWRYDFTTDTWTAKTNLPGIPRQYTAIASIEKDIYLLGGITPSGCTDELWVYHTQNDSWTLVSHFPGGGRQAPVMAAVNGKLYAGLGRCGTTYYNDWWTFDPTDLTWSLLTSFPGEARFDPIQAVVHESVLVGAGVSASGGQQDLYEYVPAFGTWKQLADFPGCGVFYTAQAAEDDHLWVINGAEADYDFCPGAYQYQAGYFANHWSNWDIDALDPVRRGGVGFLYHNRFYYVCGLDSSNNRLNKMEYITLEENETAPEGDDLLLYPTLAQNDICLQSETDLTGTASLYNAAGQPVPIQIPALFNRYLRLDVSALSPGIYLLKVMDERNGSYRVKKFFKL